MATVNSLSNCPIGKSIAWKSKSETRWQFDVFHNTTDPFQFEISEKGLKIKIPCPNFFYHWEECIINIFDAEYDPYTSNIHSCFFLYSDTIK